MSLRSASVITLLLLLFAWPAFAQSNHIIDGSSCAFSGDMGAHLSAHGIYPAGAGEAGYAYTPDFVFKTATDCERVRRGGIEACEKLRANCSIGSCSPVTGTGSTGGGSSTGGNKELQELSNKAIYEGLTHGGSDGAQLFGLGVLGSLIANMPAGDGGKAKAAAAERARQAELERQRAAAEAARLAEEARLAELERQRQAELERQRIFDAEKNGLASQFKGAGGGLAMKDEGQKVASASPCLSQPLLRFTNESDEKYAWREKQRLDGCNSKAASSTAFFSLHTPTPTPTAVANAPAGATAIPPQTGSPDWGEIIDDEPASPPATPGKRNAPPADDPQDGTHDAPAGEPSTGESPDAPPAAGGATLNQPDWSKVASGSDEHVSMEARKPFDTAGAPLVVPRMAPSGKTTTAPTPAPAPKGTAPKSGGTVASPMGASSAPLSSGTSSAPMSFAAPVATSQPSVSTPSGSTPPPAEVVFDPKKTVAMIQPPKPPAKKPVLRLQKVPPVIGATRELELQVDDVSGGGDCGGFLWTATGSLSLSPDPARAPNGGRLRSIATFVANSLGEGKIAVSCQNNPAVMASGKLTVQPPILFVHGINSDASTWNAMSNELVSRGLVPGKTLVKGGGKATSADFYACSFSHNMGDWFQEAPELKDFIERIRDRVPFKDKPPVVLVAHSMGGLASRAYLQGNAGISPEEAAARIGALVTIGTPHRGSFLAQLHETEGVLKKLLHSLADARGVEALAITSPQIKNLNANVGKIGRSVQHVSIVTVVPAKDAKAFRVLAPKVLKAKPFSVAALSLSPIAPSLALDPWAEFLADPSYQLADALPPLFERSDSLVDVASQDLKSVKGAPTHSIRIDGGIAEHLMQTGRTDLLFRGLKETGFFPYLEALPQTLCWSPSDVPELVAAPTNVELFGKLGDGYAFLKSEDFLTKVALLGLDAAVAPLPERVQAPAALTIAGGKAVIATVDRARVTVATTNDEYLAQATALRVRAQEIDALERAGKIDKAEALKRRATLRNDAKALLWRNADGRFGTRTILLNVLLSEKALAAGAAAGKASLAGTATDNVLKAAGRNHVAAWVAGQGVEHVVEQRLAADPSKPDSSLSPSCSR